MLNDMQSIPNSLSPRCVYFRQHLMPQYGGKEEQKVVLSLASESHLVDFLHAICMYASVDPITLMPVLILVNVVVLQWTLHEFGLL